MRVQLAFGRLILLSAFAKERGMIDLFPIDFGNRQKMYRTKVPGFKKIVKA